MPLPLPFASSIVIMDSFLAIDYKSIVTLVYKDEALDRLAAYGNVAQFASFGPALAPRYSRILNHSPNENLSLDVAAKALMAASPERKINIRSFRPESHQGNEFLYGLDDIRAIVAKVRYLAMSGLFVILNETIDVNDGGVSGVLQGSVIEFASGGTPRVVDTARTVSLRQSTGIKVLESVYGWNSAFIPSGGAGDKRTR